MKSARLYRSFLLALGVTLSAVSCKPQSAGGPPAMPPPTGVTVANPIAKELFDWEELTGRLDAVKTVEIRPRVSGHIASITFTPGQLVKKGDVLFTIDRRPAKALYDQATANAERAEALAGNAAREARRADELLAAKAISSEEGETRRAKLAEATATAKAAQAAKAAAALEYEFTEVISPIDGRVSRELVAEGNFVSGVAGFTTLLTTVVSVDEVYGYADMDEAAFLRISKLLAEKKLPTDEKGRAVVELQLMDESGYPRKGYFESLDNRITAATGGIVLRAVFPNTDGRLIPGLYARMRLPGSAKYQALVISEDAIQTNQNLKFVYVVDEKSTAQIRPVKVGTSTDGQRIIREGLTTADRVIVNGAKKVIPTFPVAPMSEPVAANP